MRQLPFEKYFIQVKVLESSLYLSAYTARIIMRMVFSSGFFHLPRVKTQEIIRKQ